MGGELAGDAPAHSAPRCESADLIGDMCLLCARRSTGGSRL